MAGSCEWPLSFVACQNTDVLDDLSAEDRGLVTSLATDLLWRWSGRQFGMCPDTIRPCRNTGEPFLASSKLGNRVIRGSTWSPYLLDGQWYNARCGDRCGGICACSRQNTLVLPSGTREVTKVSIDGAVLPPTDYHVERQFGGPPLLIRREGAWPASQNLSASLGEDDTWGVTLVRGLPVPPGGQVAAGLLAVELAKALCKDNTCQLPARVQTVTRQGVTVAVLDTMDDIDEGKTGIWIVDSWLASVTKARFSGSTVHSVDVPRVRLEG